MLARIGDYIARKVRRIKWKFRPYAYADFLLGKGMKIGMHRRGFGLCKIDKRQARTDAGCQRFLGGISFICRQT